VNRACLHAVIGFSIAADRMRHALRWIARKARELIDYADYRLRRRARLKQARKDDPNAYPLW